MMLKSQKSNFIGLNWFNPYQRGQLFSNVGGFPHTWAVVTWWWWWWRSAMAGLSIWLPRCCQWHGNWLPCQQRKWGEGCVWTVGTGCRCLPGAGHGTVTVRCPLTCHIIIVTSHWPASCWRGIPASFRWWTGMSRWLLVVGGGSGVVMMGGHRGWGRRRLLFVDVFVDAWFGWWPWYTEYIKVILLSFNGCLVQLLECSLIHAHDVSWSWVFNSHTWHYFWQQISWYFPYGISAESILNCSMESTWNCSMESIWTFHGIQGGYAPIPYGIHDVYGIRNWLGPLPTSIPWIPYGLYQGR